MTLGSASGGLLVGGLPFASVNVGNNYGSCTTTYASEWDAGYMNLGGLVTANAAYLSFIPTRIRNYHCSNPRQHADANLSWNHKIRTA
jgi:hypothetical protein